MPRGSAEFRFPASPGGVREDLSIEMLQPGWLLSSSNYLVRNGQGQPRPGYSAIGTVSSADTIIGIAHRGSHTLSNNILIHTLTKAWWYDGSSTTDVTGTWTTSTASQPVRMTTYRSGGTTWLVRVNAANALDKWAGTSSAFTDPTGTAPAGKDVAVVGGRLVVTNADGNDYAIQWSNLNDVDTWTSTDIIQITDTPGALVGVRALGPLSGAVYKEDSVYVISVQAALTAFQSQFAGYTSGPLAASAIVDFDGTHYWIGEDYALHSFDGSRPKIVSTALAKTLQDTFDLDDKVTMHGFLLRQNQSELWFIYPDLTTTTLIRAVSYNLATGAINPHTLTDSTTASSLWAVRSPLTIDGLDAYSSTIDGLDSAFSTIDSMTLPAMSTAIIGDSAGTFYQFGISTNDDGTAISWSAETGYAEVAGEGKRAQMDGVAAYWKKTTLSLTVTLTLTVSDSLSQAESTDTGTFNMNTDSNHFTDFTGNIGRWVKVKQSASSAIASAFHRELVVRSWPRAMV